MWVDGNEYDGEWQNGVMHGQGTLVWKTGERYDGEWKNGKEDGQGVFTHSDGSVFDGFWSQGCKHGIGLFRPSTVRGGMDAELLSIPTAHDTPRSAINSPDTGKSNSPKDTSDYLPVPPLMSPRLGSITSHVDHTASASTDTMHVREYDRGRLIRNSAIQGKEVIDMLASLIGQNVDTRSRGKVCLVQ